MDELQAAVAGVQVAPFKPHQLYIAQHTGCSELAIHGSGRLFPLLQHPRDERASLTVCVDLDQTLITTYRLSSRECAPQPPKLPDENGAAATRDPCPPPKRARVGGAPDAVGFEAQGEQYQVLVRPHAREFLESLSADPRVELVLWTAGPRSMAERKLRACGWLDDDAAAAGAIAVAPPPPPPPPPRAPSRPPCRPPSPLPSPSPWHAARSRRSVCAPAPRAHAAAPPPRASTAPP